MTSEKSNPHHTFLPAKARLVLVLLSGLAWGCKFSASASGKVNTAGDVSGDASASSEKTEPPAETAATKTITLKEGRLDYKGVINFEYDKANLKDDPDTQKTLGEFKAFLEQHPEVEIEVEGHTDSRGSDDYNRSLSDRRAASVREWLVKNGIQDSRVSSVGKGEDEPQVPEPDPCNDKLPKDQSQCEAPWATNRRVVFQVTGGAETVTQVVETKAAPSPPVEDDEPLPPPEPEEECPWLWGGHANALGPNSWLTLAGTTQPGICWLELHLDVGIGWNDFEADEPSGGSADGDYVSFTVPVRGRFWFMERHSLIGDLGLGFTHYRISADLTDAAGNDADYTRNTTPFIGHFGIGYGFRPNVAEAGPRLAVIIGGLVHLTDLADSEFAPAPGFANGLILQGAVDDETDQLGDFEPYGEVSFGWLFD